MDVEAPRSKVVPLESHGHKVDVQGSGLGTQVVCIEPDPRRTVKTVGKLRMGPLSDNPLCVFPAGLPEHGTAEVGGLTPHQ